MASFNKAVTMIRPEYENRSTQRQTAKTLALGALAGARRHLSVECHLAGDRAAASVAEQLESNAGDAIGRRPAGRESRQAGIERNHSARCRGLREHLVWLD